MPRLRTITSRLRLAPIALLLGLLSPSSGSAKDRPDEMLDVKLEVDYEERPARVCFVGSAKDFGPNKLEPPEKAPGRCVAKHKHHVGLVEV
jgi:hypothetical protein